MQHCVSIACEYEVFVVTCREIGVRRRPLEVIRGCFILVISDGNCRHWLSDDSNPSVSAENRCG